jgi:hypothetical protein
LTGFQRRRSVLRGTGGARSGRSPVAQGAIVNPGRIVAFAVLVAFPAAAGAHGDALDSYGCHKARGAGGYHCHKGPFAGRSFMSKDEMLKELAKRKGGTRRP